VADSDNNDQEVNNIVEGEQENQPEDKKSTASRQILTGNSDLCRSSMYQYSKGLSTGSRTSRARKSQFGGQPLSLSTAHSCKAS